MANNFSYFGFGYRGAPIFGCTLGPPLDPTRAHALGATLGPLLGSALASAFGYSFGPTLEPTFDCALALPSSFPLYFSRKTRKTGQNRPLAPPKVVSVYINNGGFPPKIAISVYK